MATSSLGTLHAPLLDLKAQFAAIRDEVRAAIDEVLESQHFILGPKVVECERSVAEYCGCEHGVGVSSGTDALLIALMAEGIGPGDEVITTPYTFFATVGCISRLRAEPVFVDICPKTYNLDTTQIADRITPRTRAILPVHLFGQCAEMDPILELACEHNLVVIEDAAQAIGAEYKGRRAGSMGHYGCFSFFPSKNLGCCGDGGMVTTNDAARADRLRILRAHGSKPKYHHKHIGGNFRLDALQAAIVTVKLRHLDTWTACRQANADRYRRLFAAAGLVNNPIILPHDPTSESPAPRAPGASHPPIHPSTHLPNRHIYNQFILRVPNRDALQSHLESNNIGTEVYYPVPMHTQECFAHQGYQEADMPESARAARETLAIPIYPELTNDQAQHVVDTIAGFYR